MKSYETPDSSEQEKKANFTEAISFFEERLSYAVKRKEELYDQPALLEGRNHKGELLSDVVDTKINAYHEICIELKDGNSEPAREFLDREIQEHSEVYSRNSESFEKNVNPEQVGAEEYERLKKELEKQGEELEATKRIRETLETT